MSSPPMTPTSPVHRRRRSSISLNSNRHSLSRRSSAAYSPVLSRVGSSHSYSGNLAEEFAGFNGGEGLESLADELGGWDDEDVYEEDDFTGDVGMVETRAERDSGIDVASSPLQGKLSPAAEIHSNGTGMLSPDRMTKKASKHRRKVSDYDGSEYGSDSDFETTELVSASLEARLAAVEAMARRGLEENGSDADKTIPRFTEALRDLGGQTGIEAGVTRLATAHSSLSTHLTHQTRLLQQLTSTLLSPLSAPLPPSTLDDLLPALASTLPLLPALLHPIAKPTAALRALTAHTADLSQALALLNDTLHVNRQTAQIAARRLRAARELLSDWRREDDERESAIRWIDRGGWDARLRERRCADECRQVLDGFEQVCGGWRMRLEAGFGEQRMGGIEVGPG